MAFHNQDKHDSQAKGTVRLLRSLAVRASLPGRTPVLLFLLLFLLLPWSTPILSAEDAEASLYTCPTDQEVLGFLREAGGESLSLEEEGEAHSRLAAQFQRYHLAVVNDHSEGNLRLSVEFENRSPISREMLDRANAWNRDRRYCEVYLDETENWVIESDFDCTSGVTEANIIAVIENFLTLTEGFDHYLNEL